MRNVTGSECVSEAANVVYAIEATPYIKLHMRAGRHRLIAVSAARPCICTKSILVLLSEDEELNGQSVFLKRSRIRSSS